MLTKTQINIAIVGLGWVGVNRHIPIILRNKSLHLYGVVDKHSERIQQITRKYPWVQKSLSSEGEMPWSEHVQAVLIATDPFNHFNLARKMLLAGKNVLIEKPLTMLPEESRELIEIAHQNKVSLCVVHNFQYARSTLKLKKMIDQGELGEILSIEATQFSNPLRRLPTWYERLPFGLFYDESPHMLYMLGAILGNNIQHLSSTVIVHKKQNTPLSVTGYYDSDNISVRLSMNFEAALSEWHIIVMGSKKIGVIDIFRDILVVLPNDNLHRAQEILISSGSLITTHIAGFFSSGVLLAQRKLFYGSDIVWEKFVNQVINGEKTDAISAEQGLHIVELQHQLMNKSLIISRP